MASSQLDAAPLIRIPVPSLLSLSVESLRDNNVPLLCIPGKEDTRQIRTEAWAKGTGKT